MSAFADIQQAIVAALWQAGALRVVPPILARRVKELPNDIQAALDDKGLCVYVMPPLPTSADPDFDFVLFDKTELRVRVTEKLAVNRTNATAFDLAADIAVALQWTNPGRLLLHPMQLGARPFETGPENEHWRVVDVLFEAPCHGGGARASAPFTPAGSSPTDDLFAAVLGQLTAAGTLLADVPIVAGQPRDEKGRIARALAQKSGLWLEVLPPLPTKALQGVPFVFFEEAEIIVRLCEVPAVNRHNFDAYDLIADVAESLHFQTFGGWLAQPLRIDANPVRESADPVKRQLDLAFNATFQLNA